MTAASFGQRFLAAFVGVRPDVHLNAGSQGRIGYTFRQRFWAAFLGYRLPEWAARVTDNDVVENRRTTAQQVRPGWFTIRLPRSALLLAADDDSPAVFNAEAANGSIVLILRQRDRGAQVHELELVLGADARIPAVVVVEYTSLETGRRRLLVPLVAARIGPPTSAVRLDSLDPAAPIEFSVVGAAGIGEDEDLFRRSIAAVSSGSTMRAWAEIADHAEPGSRQTIVRLLKGQ